MKFIFVLRIMLYAIFQLVQSTMRKENVTKMSLKFNIIVINTKDITAVMRTRASD